jgi:hypothetical protein
MFCPSCGVALAQQMKYCNRCGSQVLTTRDAAEIESTEKRLREEMVDLFWVTVFGLGLILGGMALIKSVLHLSDWILIAYMIVSSTAFTINFALSLWQIRRLARASAGLKGILQVGQLDTNDLEPVKARAALESVSSITENTTRTLEPISKEQITW